MIDPTGLANAEIERLKAEIERLKAEIEKYNDSIQFCSNIYEIQIEHLEALITELADALMGNPYKGWKPEHIELVQRARDATR